MSNIRLGKNFKVHLHQKNIPYWRLFIHSRIGNTIHHNVIYTWRDEEKPGENMHFITSILLSNICVLRDRIRHVTFRIQSFHNQEFFQF